VRDLKRRGAAAAFSVPHVLRRVEGWQSRTKDRQSPDISEPAARNIVFAQSAGNPCRTWPNISKCTAALNLTGGLKLYLFNSDFLNSCPVLRVPGCLSRIPDPNLFPSWIRIFPIPDPHQRIKCFNFKKLFLKRLGSRKYNPCCSSRIRIRGSKRHWIPDLGSGSATLVLS
jgi:hypothetical protein